MTPSSADPRRNPTTAVDLRRAIAETPVDAAWAQEIAIERSEPQRNDAATELRW